MCRMLIEWSLYNISNIEEIVLTDLSPPCPCTRQYSCDMPNTICTIIMRE